VADVAVGYRDQQHVMPAPGPQRRAAPGLNLAIVRMRAKGNDPQFAVFRRRLDTGDLAE
jgi:hypothetical protein